jgi:hypothetical protein
MAESGSTDNFPQAARRHWHDAQLLFEKQRLGNADQLYGLAAECALKAALGLSGLLENETTVPRKLRKHIDRVWELYLRAVEGRLAGLSHLLDHEESPFLDWSIERRYAGDDGAPVLPRVVKHREACKNCLREMLEAETLGP